MLLWSRFTQLQDGAGLLFALERTGGRESGPAGSYWTKETDQINTKLNSHAVRRACSENSRA